MQIDGAKRTVDRESSLGKQGTDRFKKIRALDSAVHIDVAGSDKARLVAEIQNHLQGAFVSRDNKWKVFFCNIHSGPFMVHGIMSKLSEATDSEKNMSESRQVSQIQYSKIQLELCSSTSNEDCILHDYDLHKGPVCLHELLTE